MISITPPKALAPKNTVSNPKRSVMESGRDSIAKAIRCPSLSLPCGTGSEASMGQSIAMVKASATISVR